MGDIYFWNVRGLNASLRQYDVKQFIVRNKVGIMCLLETHVKSNKKDEVLQKICGWESVDNYQFAPNGRIWVLWDKQFAQVQVIGGSDQHLHCHVNLDQYQFKMTVVYAKNSAREREVLWPLLTDISCSMIEPWLIVGDMNTTLLHEERMKNGVIVGGDNKELQEFCAAAVVSDLRFSGCFYTWSNKMEDGELQMRKLDRALVNGLWTSIFGSSECIFQTPETSDHSPGLIKLGDISRPQYFSFKYCNMWSKDDKFNQIVEKAWNTPVLGSPMFCLVKKLQATKKELKMLHRNEYSRMQSRIQNLKQEMDNVQT